ncbi:peptidase M28 [Clostridium sp. DL-VIII]|uniref:M28 family peptidase n=1 Tax=Clostridium sp. DL-VIII TaxID=641107 RepID=UPI00023AF65A|nr:M28 family peptidase [Clostridium sp. DL-VIII]EHI96779.1 peptidase M28 [Clostridium sp. DL-VIII]
MTNNFKIYNKFCHALDLNFSKQIMERLGQFGDDAATGNRAAGSKACYDAANYLYDKFKEAGLKNVSLDKFQVNGWTYKGANLVYKDTDGSLKKIILGGYASNIQAVNEDVTIVDGGKGTVSELKALGDIRNKLVLVSVINPLEEYWINLPSYEAHLKGAKGVLISLTCGVDHDNILFSWDLQAPAYCSTLSISIKDVKKLKALINSNPAKEIKAIFNADSVVEPYADSYNVVGEIKGRTSEVIYLTSHYDGYYHSFFDDANGVSSMLGISKAIIDSGYTPIKTIRVIAHGAEEWGQGSKDYDWLCGSYYEIEKIHPEWKEKAFALINLDGNFPIAKERNFRIYSSYELYDYTKRFIKSSIIRGFYNYEVVCPGLIIADDFCYYKNGIPTLMPGENFDNSIYFKNYYHSTMDSKKAGFDAGTYELIHKLYGKILLDFDSLPIRPLDFSTRFKIMKKELIPNIIDKDLEYAIEEACNTSKELSLAIQSINSSYSDLLKNGDHISCKSISKESIHINFMLFILLKKIQDTLLAFTWKQDIHAMTFPHSVAMQNISLLNNAISSLIAQNLPLMEIVEKYIKPIDNNSYVFEFSKENYDLFSYRIPFGNDNTFASNMIKKPNEDLYELAHSLRAKSKEPHPDLSAEINILKNSLKRQHKYLNEISAKEIEDIKIIVKLMNKIINAIT